jgi:predicted nucleotidyltransferase
VAPDFPRLLRALADGGVDFILVGGLAATVHGSARATYDVDVVYSRADGNIGRLVAALAPLAPYLRGAPPGLPFAFNTDTIRAGLNFTLTTSAGDIDLLGEITGGGDYERLTADTITIVVFGVECRCLNLDALIRVKRAAGRPRDLEVIAELEALREEQSGTKTE